MKNAGVGVGLPDWGRVILAVEDGKVHIRSGASCIGQGLGTVLTQITCTTTNLPREKVEYDRANSGNSPDSGTTSGSRQTLVTGEACRRAAEKLVLNDISTGASNDIEVATKIARDMVTKYGMSDTLGPIDFQGKEPYEMQMFGENIGDKIGEEVKTLIDTAYNDAITLLKEHRDKLDKIAETLLQKEKINEQEFKQIFEEN